MRSSNIGLKKTTKFSRVWIFEVLVNASSLIFNFFLNCYVSKQ